MSGIARRPGSRRFGLWHESEDEFRRADSLTINKNEGTPVRIVSVEEERIAAGERTNPIQDGETRREREKETLAEIGVKLDELLMEIEYREEQGEKVSDDTMREVETFFDLEAKKVDAIVALISRWQADAELARNEANSLAGRAAKFERRIARLESYVLRVMRMTHRKKIETALATMTMVEGRERVEIKAPELIPDVYMIQKPAPAPTPDLRAIKASIDGGMKVPGAELVRGESTLRWYR
jgi:hypothetical protein